MGRASARALHDALAGYTRDGAYAEFNEHRKGKPQSGHDGTSWSCLTTCSHGPKQLDQASAVLTLVWGRVTWQAA
jgi:predicted amidohydrolase YtcJ